MCLIGIGGTKESIFCPPQEQNFLSMQVDGANSKLGSDIAGSDGSCNVTFLPQFNIRTVELTSNRKVIPSNVMFFNDKLY
jgi:hypothetical protein